MSGKIRNKGNEADQTGVNTTDHLYRMLFENSMDAILLTAPDGTIYAANPAACKMYGRTEEEICKIGRSGLIDTSDPRLITLIEERQRNGRVKGEMTGIRKNGDKFPVELSSSVFTDPDGQFRTSMIIHDISARIHTQAVQNIRNSILEFSYHADIEQLLQKALDETEQVTRSEFSFFQLIKDNQKNLTLQVWSANTKVKLNHTDRIMSDPLFKVSEPDELLPFRLPVIHNDRHSLVLPEFLPDGFPAVIREMIIPILRNEKIVAILGLFNKETDYNEWELNAACLVADQVWEILDRKLAEEALRRSETLFRNYFDLPAAGIAITTPEMQWINANDRLCKMLGYSKEELLQITWPEFTHPDDLSPDLTDFNRVLTGEIDGYSIDKRFIRKNGETIWASLTARGVRLADGRVDYLISIVVDITKRKLQEQALAESEELFRKIFEDSKTGIVLTDRNHNFLRVNPAFCMMLGYTLEELSNLTFEDITHPDHSEIDTSNVEKLWEGEIPYYKTEKRYRTKKGDVIWAKLSTSIIKGHDNRPLYALAAIENITEGKIAEIQRMEALQWQNSVLGAINDILMEVNNNKMYTWANQAGYDFFGEDVIGKSAEYYFEGEQDTYERVQPLFDGNKETVYVESWQRRKDGEKRLLAWWCKVLKNADGEIIGGLSSARDITDVKITKDELRSSREQLRDLNQYLRKIREEERKLISRDLHDELGQALTAIKIDLNLLKKRTENEGIRSDLDKITLLVRESINSVKRITSELRPNVLDDLGLLPAIEWYTGEFSKRTGIIIRLSLETEISFSPDVELVIFRIMQESLTNIARHSKAMKGEIKFHSRLNKVILEVKDDGTGISDENLKSSRSLGLLNMRERAKEIGGRLEIVSGPEGGTCVRLILPVNPE